MATVEHIEAFKARWLATEGAERSNSQSFLIELCDLMGVPRPDGATSDPDLDHYIFERRVKLAHPGGDRAGFIDLYKRGCFVLESKQGANHHKKGGFAKRDTPAWENEMENARGQAKGYAQTLDEVPPFIVVCDVGHVFEIHASFDGTAHWTAFPAPPANRIYLRDLSEEKLAVLRAIWTEPLSLDPSRNQAKVSREVAAMLADLARALEARYTPEAVARFLMRCIFTMFAEDIGLFPEKKKLFEEHLEQYWVKNPAGFPAGVQVFWSTMNTGGPLLSGQVLRRFNGGLFAESSGLALERYELELLLEAARHDWSQVEPAIFGTLLERALDAKERHRLGAHYTPRAYVERLVRPTIEEPLRADWLVVQSDARRLREAGKVKDAAKALQQFHKKLCEVRVLDPACGSGNFLYVALDLMKQLEAEVREELWRLGDQNELLEFDGTTVRPKQFLGIEKKPWAKEIAELVLWIGYLRWHFRAKGDRGEVPVPEPVLEDYGNIECRDAVLDWDGAPNPKLAVDETGRPRKRWSGRAGYATEQPGAMTEVLQYEYPNPRKPGWPEADFIVGNPPFVGTRRMRIVLGDGYVDALTVAADEVPDNADYVMYWWNMAAERVRAGRARAFGLITTNSITQTFNRALVKHHLTAKEALSIVFAIPDHPWVDSEDGAAVRVAMTVGVAGDRPGRLHTVVTEQPGAEGTVEATLSPARVGAITHDLRVGASPAAAMPLLSNSGIAYWGVKFYGDGFKVSPAQAEELAVASGGQLARPFVSGKDLTARPRGMWVVDCDGIESEDELRDRFPGFYQHLLIHVKPERIKNPRAFKRERWWIHGENQPGMRRAVRELERYVVTVETATHRVFTFLERPMLAEGTVCVVAVDDAFSLGVLSSRVHVTWALAAGGRLGVGNDPRYNKTRCFDPFPFPMATDAQKERIGEVASKIDEHRKRQLAAHPKLTMTGMYNVLAKLRAAEPLAEKDEAVHQAALVSLLRTLHDELDAAVLDAYGWPATLTDEEILERLVALNAERAAEEQRGLVRWLRPEYQAPKATKPTQVSVPGTEPVAKPAPAAAAKAPGWPKHFSERVVLVRDAVLTASSEASFSAAEVAARFKRAKPADVEQILEGFVALGHLVAFTDPNGTRRWARPARAA